MQIEEMLAILPAYQTINYNSSLQINGVRMDHREVSKGDLFICIKGFTVDGHRFAPEAVEKGATVIVSERDLGLKNVTTVIVPNTIRALALIAAKFYQYPTTSLTLVGITGTNGKTTTTYVLEKILQKHELKTGLIGTIQMKIGEKTSPMKNTTPDSLRLQEIFHRMVREQVDIAVMEVSSHALDLGRVYGCDYDIAVFTNLSQDHLDYHKNMEDYLRAKTLLFTGLGNTYAKKQKFAVLNADDAHSEIIASSTTQPILTYGIEQRADVMATQIQYGITNTSFLVTTPDGELFITSHLIGKFNIYNMLAAISVAYLQRIPLATIQDALEEITGIDGRFERVNAGQDFAVIVDYAHTPDSLENVLQTIQDFAKRKIYTVVGSGGDRDRSKRPLMAKAALQYSDWAIFTSDNPRTEKPEEILKDMTKDLTDSHFQVIENRKAAIEQAVTLADKDDIILIAGKGHETYQEIHGIRYDFDDRIIARNAIEQKGL